jgi:CHAT domain-containing protein
VVVPHGPLHQLSFAALPDADERPLLVRTPALCYAPSATVLLRPRATPTPAALRPCLALGYDGAQGYELRHTEAEAAAIAALCGGDAWHGAPGARARLERVAGDYRWLHLACHGEFDLAEPLRSALEVGPGERLSAAEVIAGWSLRADLVVLSACRSGVSHIVRGDEPMGLVRAFLKAGAAMVLVTLWPVEDTSARLFMECFYGALVAQGRDCDPAVALRHAQQTLRTATSAELQASRRAWSTPGAGELDISYADPLYWAGYVLVQGRR